MYCILVTGIPAAGKSTMAAVLSEKFQIPVISKDSIKERLFDEIGFRSREEKVRLGFAAMKEMYYFAEQLMRQELPFILENNFENCSRPDLMQLLEAYDYQAITVTLTGDYETIYQRFIMRNSSPERHRGHVVNDCYPEQNPGQFVPPISFELYAASNRERGMDSFCANGPHIVVDTTDFSRVNMERTVDHILEMIHTLR